jgi:hypothetical protein
VWTGRKENVCALVLSTLPLSITLTVTLPTCPEGVTHFTSVEDCHKPADSPSRVLPNLHSKELVWGKWLPMTVT